MKQITIHTCVETVCLIMLCCCIVNSADPYCSSLCADNIGACFGTGQNDCYACSQSVFLLQRNSSGVCQLKTQHEIAFYELRNSGFNLNTYSASQPGPLTCDLYTLTGQYVSGDYIQKTFTGIPLNHYQVVIRFTIALIGAWNPTDQIKLAIDGYSYTWNYNLCSDPQFLCNSAGTPSDCIKIYEKVVSHDASSLALKFSTSITEIDPNNQYWALKDIVILTRTCHSGCSTCFGPAQADCITCAQGYYLHGNLCVLKCQFLALTDKRICVQQCPIGYFQGQNKLCQTCQKDCLVCSSSSSCSAWSDKKEGLVWVENKMFWILIIIIGLLIILYTIWKCFIKKYLKNRNMSEVHDDMKQNMVSNQNLEHTNAPKETRKDTSSSSDSRDSKGGKNQERSETNLHMQNRPHSNRDIVFQESGMQWLGQIPIVDQVIVSGYSANGQRKKKKRFRPIEQGATQCIQLNGTVQSIKL